MNSGYVYRERVQPSGNGTSVLDYYIARFRHSTAHHWRSVIECGLVFLNDRATRADEILRAGDLLEYHRPPWVEPDAPSAFELVYEDSDVLAVSKPPGLQVLPAGAFYTRTLLHLVRASDPSRADSSPVHRLGRGTSGLVLFGKTAMARASLSAQFRDRAAVKTYLALVCGTALANSCIARHPIGPVPHGPLQLYCAVPDGKPSVTRVRVLARDSFREQSLVAAQPITGRPDQIRIHLAACGAPIVGDPLFGVGGVAISDARPGDGGYFLHATALRVVHPVSGAALKLRSAPAWLDSRA